MLETLIMDDQSKIAGGIFVFVLMFLTAAPLNDEVQGFALAAGASEVVKAFALVFPIMWVGIAFIILAFVGNDIIESFT